MYQIKTEIEGIAPILFNRFTEENQKDVEVGRSTGRQTADAKKELSLNKVYRNNDGLFCPASNVKKATVLACGISQLKHGRKSLGPIINAVLFLDPMEIPFGVSKPDFIHEQVGRIPPRTGARVILYRPALNIGWKLSFTINVFADSVGFEQVKRALQDAGIFQGLCDGRPEYGRFIVNTFELIKEK